MKSLYLLLLLVSVFFTPTFAQYPGGGGGGTPAITGKVVGILIDSTTNNPVEFATIVLFSPEQNKQIDGTITDVKGEFKLQNVKLGTYDLQISFIGYKNKVIKNITLTPQKPDYELPKVLLASQSTTLAEVEITGQAAVVENRIDKLVYNAEKDVTSIGGDASNVLQKVPLLSVDAEGNVSLRGSSNVQILINGKPSTMFSSNVADALKSIPADQIKSVEVITSPTAKYDGEGSSGIINIITKKQSAQGFTGSVNGSVGNRSNRGSLSLNLTRGRFGVNFNGSGWYNPNRPSYSEEFRLNKLDQSTLTQNGSGESAFYGPRASLGLFYDLNAYNNISSSVNFRGFGRNQTELTDVTFLNPADSIAQIYSFTSASKSLRSGFDWNTDYKRTFKRPEQELEIGFELDTDLENSENEFDQFGNASAPRVRNFNDNDGKNAEITAQVDYTHPFSPAVKMETGVKGVLRSIDSDFSYQNFDFDRNSFVEVPSRSDIFYYDQNVYAGYLSFNMKLGKNYGMIVGGRYEHTDIAGDYKTDATNFSNSYGNFLPSFIVSRSFKNFSTLKFSYNQRIRRPGLFYVNPYIQQENSLEQRVGNPEVLPEKTNQLDLNYSMFVKGITLNGSVFYRYTSDIIEEFLEITNEQVSLTSFRNIGANKSLGVSLYTSINIKEKFMLRGGGNVSSYQSEGTVNGIALSRTSVQWNANLNATVTLPKGFRIEAFGFYNAPRQSLQGSRASYSQVSFGLLKEFSKKFSLGLNISQPFARDLKFENILETPILYQRSLSATAARSIGVSFSYRFGKLDFRQRNERGERNDDLKQGDDQGQ